MRYKLSVVAGLFVLAFALLLTAKTEATSRTLAGPVAPITPTLAISGSGQSRAGPDVPTPPKATHKGELDAPIGFVIDDGVAERALGFGSATYNRSGPAIWLNRFIPGSISYPLTLDTIQILFPGESAGHFVGKSIRLLVYLDLDSNNNPNNAVLMYESIRTIEVADWYTFQAFPVNVVINSPGDIYVGWEDYWAEGGPSPWEFVAAQDTTNPQRRSWFAGPQYINVTPNIFNLGVNYYLGRIESVFGTPYAGNWLIRATGNTYEPPTATPTATPTPIPPRCPSERFTDVCPGDYFYLPVLRLYDVGIISGYNSAPPCDGPRHIPCFKPNNNTTRGQLSKIAVLGASWSIYTPPIPSFSDVPPNHSFYQYIETAYHHGIISGYTCGLGCLEFRPGNNVTRGQLCKIVVLAEGWSLYTPPTPTFRDVPTTDPFYAHVETAYQHGIISGYTCGSGCLEFRPGNNATRGQIAKIVYSAINEPTPTSTPTTIPTFTYTTTPTDTTTPTETATEAAVATETPTPSPTTLNK